MVPFPNLCERLSDFSLPSLSSCFSLTSDEPPLPSATPIVAAASRVLCTFPWLTWQRALLLFRPRPVCPVPWLRWLLALLLSPPRPVYPFSVWLLVLRLSPSRLVCRFPSLAWLLALLFCRRRGPCVRSRGLHGCLLSYCRRRVPCVWSPLLT